jgi:SAM-dependent methyltransferase
VDDAAVDVVTTRSVLIYVKDKAGALREFQRVLRPGGRISLYEPINVLMHVGDPDCFSGYDTRRVRAIAAKLDTLYESIHRSLKRGLHLGLLAQPTSSRLRPGPDPGAGLPHLAGGVRPGPGVPAGPGPCRAWLNPGPARPSRRARTSRPAGS